MIAQDLDLVDTFSLLLRANVDDRYDGTGTTG